jgi:hypothetical protein
LPALLHRAGISNVRELAVLVHRQLQSEYSIAIHFGTFQLADDGQDEAISELARARAELGVSAERFRVLGFGEGWDIP